LSKQKKLLMWTVWIVSLIQMIGSAMSPAMNVIKTSVFSQYPLSTIQTVMSLSGLVSPFVALLSAELIRRGLVTKRNVVLTGLFTLGANGLLSILLHTQLWHLGFMSVLTGIASGCYLSTVLSIMMDKFSPEERQVVTGLQSVFVNVGGFLISLVGGILAAWHWYGGYLILLVGFPIGIMSILTLPKETRVRQEKKDTSQEKSRFDSDIFFYAVTVLVFMLNFAVINANLAVHMASSGFQNTALVGVIVSVQMAGGMAFGFLFPKLTRILNDRLLYVAFFMLFVSLTMLNVFHTSLLLIGVSVFIAGASLSLIGPHCVVAVAHCVEARTSALATSLVTGLAPGLGSFLSPVIFTNLTTAIAGESTSFRYQFVALFALACAAVLIVYMVFREKRKSALTPTPAAIRE
jgi:MFS family permease